MTTEIEVFAEDFTMPSDAPAWHSGLGAAASPVRSLWSALLGVCVAAAAAGAFLLPHPGHAAPLLEWPVDCDHYWNVGDLKESYFVGGPNVKGEAVISCFNTVVGGPGGVQGPAADDMHMVIDSPNGGSFRIGTEGYQVSINGVPQTLGAGNQAGDSFNFPPGVSNVELVKHDGVDRMMPIKNENLNTDLCVYFSDAGVVLPGPDPCAVDIGQPPLPIPDEEIPPPDPRFPIFQFSALAPGITFFAAPEPSTLVLVAIAFLVLVGRRWGR